MTNSGAALAVRQQLQRALDHIQSDTVILLVMSGRLGRLRTWCGVVGPVAFTGAWIVSGHLQRDYSIWNEHVSGLAAPDARAPFVMAGGFAVLGLCTVAFADELHRRLGGREGAGYGPSLMAGAGLSVVLAALLRRDRMTNRLPGETEPYQQSLVNDGHDYASMTGQACGLLSMVALSRRFGTDPSWGPLRWPALTAAAVSGGLSVYFSAETGRPGNGVVQRAGITAALAAMAALAVRMLRAPLAMPPPGP